MEIFDKSLEALDPGLYSDKRSITMQPAEALANVEKFLVIAWKILKAEPLYNDNKSENEYLKNQFRKDFKEITPQDLAIVKTEIENATFDDEKKNFEQPLPPVLVTDFISVHDTQSALDLTKDEKNMYRKQNASFINLGEFVLRVAGIEKVTDLEVFFVKKTAIMDVYETKMGQRFQFIYQLSGATDAKSVGIDLNSRDFNEEKNEWWVHPITWAAEVLYKKHDDRLQQLYEKINAKKNTVLKLQERLENLELGVIKIDRQPDIPYEHRLKWLENPINSGTIRCAPIVTAAISSAWHALTERVSWVMENQANKPIDAELFQHDPMMRGPFTTLVAAHVSVVANNFPKKYLPPGLKKASEREQIEAVIKIRDNFLPVYNNRTKQITGFKLLTRSERTAIAKTKREQASYF